MKTTHQSESRELAAAALHALPGQIAVLDADGIVHSVNRDWQAANSAIGAETTVGSSLMDTFAAEEPADVDSIALQDRVAAVLKGGPGFETLLPRHGKDRARWYRLIVAPLDPPGSGAVVMYQDVTADVQTEIRLHRLATYDDLTGVLRRGRFIDRLDDAVKSARRYGHPLALAVADLDRLKAINDTYGHATGDACLAAFAATMSGAVRATDFVGRFGGDEFLLCFPHTRMSDVHVGLERLRVAFAESVRDAHIPASCTATFGVAELRPGMDGAGLIAAADAALYAGKSSGRDRIETAAHARAANADA